MKVSVIIPCYNEEEVLPLSHKRFSQVMGSTAHDYELIFVNDGSKDHTEELLLGFANDDPHTKVISFSRNFGHQNAVSAGLHNCTGDIAVIIDVDLQDPPEVIPQMIDTYLKEGSNVVYAVRNKREGETFMKNSPPRFIIACSTLYLTTHFLSIQAISGSSIARFWMHSNSFPKSINICGDFSVGWDLNKLRSIIPVTNVLPAERNIPYEKCFH